MGHHSQYINNLLIYTNKNDLFFTLVTSQLLQVKKILKQTKVHKKY